MSKPRTERLSRFNVGGVKLRTWIDEGDRHAVLNERLRLCEAKQVVRFMAITGRSVMLPDKPGMSLIAQPFPAAVSRHALFQGLLMDPDGFEARFRSEIESPSEPERQRLLQRDAREVADRLKEHYQSAGISKAVTNASLELKYVTIGIPFSLWLFHDVALMEPYHFGKRGGVGNLCEFAQMIVPAQDVSYELLRNHFENIWKHAPSRPVWPPTGQ